MLEKDNPVSVEILPSIFKGKLQSLIKNHIQDNLPKPSQSVLIQALKAEDQEKIDLSLKQNVIKNI